MADFGRTRYAADGKIVIEIVEGLTMYQGVSHECRDFTRGTDEPTMDELCENWGIDIEEFDEKVAPKLRYLFHNPAPRAQTKEEYNWHLHRRASMRSRKK